MPAGRITGFSGIVPRAGARILRDNEAQIAANCRFTSGYFVPLRAPLNLNLVTVPTIGSMYRMVDAAGAGFMLAWDRDVDAVRGPVESDPTYRTYFTGAGEPRVTNLALATASTPYPAQWFVLGVTPPVTAPAVSHAGGAGAVVSRSFRYTFVTPWGEESAPSPESAVVSGRVDGTWTVGVPDVAPLNTFTVTGSSWSAGVATLTVASTFGLRVGEETTVAGMNPAGFNGARRRISALTPTSVSFLLAVNPGAFVAGGTIARDAPHNTSGMVKRIYWSETTVSGNRYGQVDECPVATVSRAVPGNTLATNSLVTVGWAMPPTDLKGLVAMPNNFLAGFRANEVWFSQINVPYAWSFSEALAHEVVAIAATGSTLIVGTNGSPYTVSGIDPQSLSVLQESSPFPCVSKRSMVVLEGRVAYASPQGLVGASGPGNFGIITRNVFTEEEWTPLFPQTFFAANYRGRYVTTYCGINGCQMLIFDPSEFASAVTANVKGLVLYGEQATGRLYLTIDNVVHEWDADRGRRLAGEFMSKEFVFPMACNIAVARIEADFAMSPEDAAALIAVRNGVLASNQAILTSLITRGPLNTSALNARRLGGSRTQMVPTLSLDECQFQIITDGVVRDTRDIASSDWIRLRGGYTSDNMTIRIAGNVTVKAVQFAESIKQARQA